ncbi:DgyrCDS13012 [Dimorphilus gyrociliatus]|uniref:DgyrCDS13012 n=1 Tax=Dimorphilus gyrociliatus TaxID=2664684 RepID=A0A7I8W9D3_9ANNE|nr:DgyrCDS13012 [Dimorphilus gyrociliatus]
MPTKNPEPQTESFPEQNADTTVAECRPNLNSTVPSASDNSFYYNCVNGQGWRQVCPPGTQFNPSLSLENSKSVICSKIPDGSELVHGEWSQWTSWSNCAAPCGNGVEGREPTCSSPPPANGGKNCRGKSLEERPCNNGPCAELAFMVSLKRTVNVNPGVMN